jgi:hypothetical protein
MYELPAAAREYQAPRTEADGSGAVAALKGWPMATQTPQRR